MFLVATLKSMYWSKWNGDDICWYWKGQDDKKNKESTATKMSFWNDWWGIKEAPGVC